MSIMQTLLLLLLSLGCCGQEIFIRMDEQLFRIGNIHLFDISKMHSSRQNLLVSKYRDVFLEPVKYTVKSVIDGKSPSNLRVGAKIELENDEKFLTGKIIGFDEYFIESTLKIKRGDSGKAVIIDNKTAGLISFYKNRNSFIVRIDNLTPYEFEKITPQNLAEDLKLFNSTKECEYTVIKGLMKSSSAHEMKNFLRHCQMPDAAKHKWHSSYLENNFNASIESIRKIQKKLNLK